ncbi:MAG: BCCT family transporter, partial [Eubacterium sp.]
LIVLSGTTVYMQLNVPSSHLVEALNLGYQNVAYQVFRNLPFSDILMIIYALAVFISFVTAIDSNTTIMAAISTKGISHDNSEAPGSIKLIWGLMIGALSFVMVLFTGGVTGCKMLANIGGFPIVFFLIIIGIGAVKVFKKPYLYDLNKEDYDLYGHPIAQKVNDLKHGD